MKIQTFFFFLRGGGVGGLGKGGGVGLGWVRMDRNREVKLV